MTTDNLPAVVEPREVATADVDSWISVASDVIKLANLIAPTEFVPRSLRDSAPATAAAILYGREVGLPPMTALTQTHVIEGRPAMSAEAMRALVFAAGHEIEVVESTRARCEIRGRRHGREKWTTVAVGIDEFRHLASKANWSNYPRQMLLARASAELCRSLFPDVIHGFRAVEEFDDLDARPDETTPTPSTRVTRRSAAAKRAAKSLPAPLEQRPETTTGPPLPGEPGYETSAGDSSPTSRGSSTDTETGDRPAPVESPADAQTTDTGAPVAGAEETPAGNGVGEAPEPAGDSTGETPGGESPGGHGESEGAPEPGGTGAPEDRGPRKSTRAQQRMIHGLLNEIHGGEKIPDQDRYDIASAIVHRRIGSFNDLTHDNAATLIDTLGRVQTSEELAELIRAAAKAEADRWNQGDRS